MNAQKLGEKIETYFQIRRRLYEPGLVCLENCDTVATRLRFYNSAQKHFASPKSRRRLITTAASCCAWRSHTSPPKFAKQNGVFINHHISEPTIPLLLLYQRYPHGQQSPWWHS